MAAQAVTTRRPADGDRLERGQILAALRAFGVTSLEPVAGATDTDVWRADGAGGTLAVRIFRPGASARIGREAAAIAAAAAGGIPVPETVAILDIDGREAMLQAWVDGMSLLACLGQAPEQARNLGRLAGRVQAQLNGVPAPDGWAGGEWADWVPGLLTPAPPVTAPARLLHLDLHPGNLLVRDGRVVAVIDWVNARGGPPAADLARTYSILAGDPSIPPTWRSLSRDLWRGWREGYEEVSGRLPDLGPYVAWATAVMTRDLRGRVAPAEAAALARREARWAARAARKRAPGGRTPYDDAAR